MVEASMAAAALGGCGCELCGVADTAVAYRSHDRDAFMMNGYEMAVES